MTRLATKALAATALSLTLLAGCSALDAVTGAVGGGSAYSAPAAQLGMPTASPESQGYSTAGIDAVNKFGQGSIGFPFTVFTDNQGRIVLFHLGEIHKEQADVLLGAVRDVNSGKLTPAAARVVVAKQLAAMPSEPAPG